MPLQSFSLDETFATAAGVVTPNNSAVPEDGLEGTIRLTAGTAVVNILGNGIVVKTITLPLTGNRGGQMSENFLMLGDFTTWGWQVVSISGGGTVRCTAKAMARDRILTVEHLKGGQSIPPTLQALMSGAGRLRSDPLRIATFGDSTANFGPSNFDQSQITAAFPASGATVLPLQTLEKLGIASRYPRAYVVANGGISGNSTVDMLARNSAGAGPTRKSTADILSMRPDVIIARCGSINDFLGVVPATIDATVAAVASRHAQLIAQLASGNAVVIDEGIAGFNTGSNVPTDLEATRTTLRRLNALYAAAAKPPRVLWLDPVGVTCDASGAYLPGLSTDGTHPNAAGQYAIGQAELAVINAYFGASLSRYDGANLASGSNMAVTAVQAYGALAAGYAINVSNATRQNAAVVVGADGKLWQTCEFTSTAASGQGQIALPYTPASWGLIATDVLGIEFDFFVESIDQTSNLPDFVNGGILGRVDTYKTGAGRVVLDALGLSVAQTVSRSRIEGRCIFQPWLVGEASAALTTSSTALLSTTVAQSGQSWRIGVSDFRVVKLGATRVST